jgi:hypothetical protein
MKQRFISLIFFHLLTGLASGQDTRGQYPSYLKNSFFGVNAGYINYSFSSRQLEPGFTAESIHIPHTAVRVILFGHRFTDFLAAQISYLRPVGWVEYRNVNGSMASHKVGMNIAGLTLTSGVPLGRKFTINNELGWGIITRSGFIIDNETVVKDASYSTLLLGAGAAYKLNEKWELLANATWSPAHRKVAQPGTLFFSGGFNYTMRTLSPEKLEKKKKTGYIFPKHLLQIGMSTNSLGYGVNRLFSKTLPIFWGGDVKVKRGFTIQYQRNIFHARKVFSLDLGATLGHWQTRSNNEKFLSFAVFPLLRFTAVRTKPVDIYLNYSLAGPAFISKTILDAHDTGKRFTFQDFMGLGMFAGKKRQWNAEMRIAHFSNGNIFPKNDGIMIPLNFILGYSFDNQ